MPYCGSTYLYDSRQNGLRPAIASPLPELLAPAGSWDCAKAAIENGADAIYFGLDRLSARMRAENFTEADLPELMAELHRRGVKGYLTRNTLIFTGELPQVETYLRSAIAAGVEHVLQTDAGCRNTLFNGAAQTGAEYVQRLLNAGLRHVRIEFLQESAGEVSQTLRHYQQLLSQEISGAELWQTLKL